MATQTSGNESHNVSVAGQICERRCFFASGDALQRGRSDQCCGEIVQEERRMSEIKALVHDVFGTVVDWRGAVTADGEELARRNGITGVDWQEFADEWRGA